jgi:HTH-type transcriptional regulator/antitoxin HigA
MVKKKMTSLADYCQAAEAWGQLNRSLGLAISLEFTSVNAKAMTSLVDGILESGELSMQDPLVVFLMDWIAEYERRFVPLAAASPAEVLRHLMEANGLKQADLATELGGQPVVSAILNGKRGINAGQALRLSKRFRVSPAVFIDPQAPAPAPGTHERRRSRTAAPAPRANGQRST